MKAPLTWPLAILCGLVGSLFGAMLVIAIGEPAPTSVSPQSSASSADPELIEAIRSLSDKIDDFRAVPFNAAPSDPERTPVGIDDQRLEQQVRSIVSGLTREMKSGRNQPRLETAHLSRKKSEKQRENLEKITLVEHEERMKANLFWTYQEVLESYGFPDEVTGDASMMWFYEDPITGNVLQFKFCEGWVIAVYD